MVLPQGRMKTAAGWSLDFRHEESCARRTVQFNKNIKEPSAEGGAGGRGGSEVPLPKNRVGSSGIQSLSDGPYLMFNIEHA